jgi:ParB-like chromosome segregation protein Spo0J
MGAESIAKPPSGHDGEQINLVDIPLADLIPLRKRTGKKLVFERLESNIRAVGLLEPLLVHPYEGRYFILDGYLRYLVLSDLEVTTVPCLLIPTLDAYTPNRQVNYLSMSQRWTMLKRALTVVDEDRLKTALAIKELRHSLSENQRAALCAEVQERVQDDCLSRSAATHLIHVNEDRQRAILELIDQAGDASVAFIRAQILRTPQEQRIQRSERSSPWRKAGEVRRKLAERLSEAEKHADFYQGLYRQYARDLTVLAVYARDLLSHKDVRECMAKRFPDEVKLFREIIQQTDEPERK